MSKNRKKAKKSKDSVPPASAQQCSEPVDVSVSSEPVNESMSNGESERFSEEASGVNKNKEHSATSLSKMLHTTTDEHSMKSEPPESNPEELSQLKNTCRALKSNLNAMKKKYDEEKQEKESSLEEISRMKNTCNALKSNLNAMKKKYEGEKQEKEKLSEENQDLKSKLSLAERELQAAIMQIQKFKEERAQHQYEQMEVETTMDNVREQQEQEASVDFTCEKKEDNLVQYNAKGMVEEACSIVEQDTEMAESFSRGESGVAKGNDQDTDSNWCEADDKQWDNAPSAGHANIARIAKVNNPDTDGNWGEVDDKQRDKAPSAWYEDTDAGSNRQPVPATSGRDTRWQKRGESGQPPHRNEEQNYGPCHFRNSGRGKGLDNRGDRDQNFRRGVDDRGDRGQNYNDGRGRGREFNNRGDRDQNFRRGMDDRGDRGQNCNDNWGRGRGFDNRGDRDQNFRREVDHRGDNRMRTTDEPPVVIEIFGDLFTAPSDCSLAHCVAEDMRMGSGIAVTFRQTFKHVDELLDQGKRQGHVAVLEHEGRYIYYLVTKRESTGKPTMETLQRSLEAMRDHVKENQVKKIAMPRIGCGLDRLDWQKVRPLIEETFRGTGAQITIYNYNEDMGESSKQKSASNVRLRHAEKPVADIEPGTAILCLCTADGSVDSTLESVDRKFRIMTQYQQMDRKLGNILEISKPNYLILLLIVKEKKNSPLSFSVLGKCVRQACKMIEKANYYYVAVESFDDAEEPFLFEKVITVIKHYLDTKWEKELWLCCPKTVSW